MLPTCKTTHEQLCKCITSNARHSTGRRLKEAGLEGSAVDFLSVDVEGVELMVRIELHATSCACNSTELFCRTEVLKSIDLAAIKFPVIIAENNGGSDAIENFLATLG